MQKLFGPAADHCMNEAKTRGALICHLVLGWRLELEVDMLGQVLALC